MSSQEAEIVYPWILSDYIIRVLSSSLWVPEKGEVRPVVMWSHLTAGADTNSREPQKGPLEKQSASTRAYPHTVREAPSSLMREQGRGPLFQTLKRRD